MNERRAVAVLVDFLQVNNKLSLIMLRVCQDLGSKQGNDMVRDDLARFILEVGIVDAEVGVKPVDFACDELAGDEALCGDVTLNQRTLFLLAFENGRGVPWRIIDAMQGRFAAVCRAHVEETLSEFVGIVKERYTRSRFNGSGHRWEMSAVKNIGWKQNEANSELECLNSFREHMTAIPRRRYELALTSGRVSSKRL